MVVARTMASATLKSRTTEHQSFQNPENGFQQLEIRISNWKTQKV
jgi:hypothetical protein